MSATLPADFIDQMQQLLGEDEAQKLCHVLTQTPSCTSVRLNASKYFQQHQQAEAARAESSSQTPNLSFDKVVPWCAEAYYLHERPRFTFDPRLHAGAYYVQEAASMFIAQAYARIAQDFQPQRLLDLCAAPGGKSTLWRSLLPDEALLVANEIVKQRAQILAENLSKWGHPDTICTCAAAQDFADLQGFFDVVAADVPCSGEGMFRKDENARSEWSRTAVLNCAQRQRDIIGNIWDCLREGGYLVYSTCTFNREENEDNVEFICRELGAELVPIPTVEEWQIKGDCTQQNLAVYRFFPHHSEGEGLFLALLRKTTPSAAPRKPKRNKDKGTNIAPAVAKNLLTWLKTPESFTLLQEQDQYIALRKTLSEDMQRIAQQVSCLSRGVALATEKGKKLIPQHALALSTELSETAFPRIALSHEQAIAYLRRESLTLPPDTPRGYIVLCYEGLPLGFANNLGTRANNLYPEAWRIRKQKP